MRRLIAFALVVSLFASAISTAKADEAPTVRIMRTPSGVRFGLLGEKGPAPAPTLFVFGSSLENSLRDKHLIEVGHLLARQGFLSVSLDMPCHGQDVSAGEPAGLTGWRVRLEKGKKLISDFVRDASAVLDYLIHEGYTDPERVAVCGTSRGGFIALHFAAVEPRVHSVAAFAPVTDLLALSEFDGMDHHSATNALSVIHQAGKLAGRPLWLCIGNLDVRVGTDDSIALTRKIVEESQRQNKPAPVELHVMHTIGHRIHDTAHAEAATWFLKQTKKQDQRTESN